MDTLLFWTFLFGSIYSYALYPLVLMLFRGRETPPPGPPAEWPKLALIVTAHNEALRIRSKLDNCLEIDYPRDRLDIVVASDASEDETDTIVRRYNASGIRLVRSPQRRGKESAQWLAIQNTDAPILVFSDVATRIPPEAPKAIATLFSDPQIGAVSSEDRFLTVDGRPAGEGVYVRYEMWLRRLESSVNSLVGLSGSFFAARRAVCRQWDTASPSDFNTALNAVSCGYKAISSPQVLGFYPDIKDQGGEYRRKVRTVTRGMTSVARHRAILNPFRYGLFSFQVASHKLMRWLVPWFLLGLLATSVLLSIEEGAYFFRFVLAAQLLFYGLFLLGSLSEAFRRRGLIRIVFYFVQANVAVAHATLGFLAGRRVVLWQPSVR